MDKQTNLQVIEGSFGGGSSPHIPVITRDTLQSSQKVHALIAVSEGEITSIDTLYLNEIPYQLTDTQSIVTWDYRSGTSNQSIITGFTNVESVLESFQSQAIQKSTSTINHDVILPIGAGKQAARLTFSTTGMHQKQSNGDIIGTTIEFNIYTRQTSAGVWNFLQKYTKTGKTTSAYAWDIRVEAPSNMTGNTQWQIKIERITADSTSTDIANTLTLANVTEIEYNNILTSDGKQLIAYNGTALLSIIIKDAEFFNGNTPTVLAYGKWIKVPIPSNYDSTTRTYTGNWDGTFKPAGVSTDNVAFIILYCLNSSKCLGIDMADIDKYAFYELAKHCDEQVPNGTGGTIPRYTCNNQFIVKETVQVFLNYLFSLCNANIITNELGQISVMWDRRGQSVTKLVTNANVIEGIFTYASNDLESRTSTVNVTYSNINNFSKTDTVTVTDIAMINRYGLYTVDVALPGCKYEAQAVRKGYWVLYNNCYLTGTVTFQVAFYGLSFKLGEIIQIQDNYNNSNAIGGRIISYKAESNGNTTIIFDRTIDLIAGVYTFTFNLSDGTTIKQEANITVANGSYSSWTFTDTFIPYIGSIFIATKVKNLYKIIKITKDDTDTYTVTANQHDEAKYDYIDGLAPYTDNAVNLVNATGDYGNIVPHGISDITNLTISPVFTPKVGSWGTNSELVIDNSLKVTWTPPANASKTIYYKLTWSFNDGGEHHINRVNVPEYEIIDVRQGVYTVKVTAYDSVSNNFSKTVSASADFGISFFIPPTIVQLTGESLNREHASYYPEDYQGVATFTKGDIQFILLQAIENEWQQLYNTETLIGYKVFIGIDTTTVEGNVVSGVTLTTTPTIIDSFFVPTTNTSDKEYVTYSFAKNQIASLKYVDRAQRKVKIFACCVNSLNKLGALRERYFNNPAPSSPLLAIQTNGKSVHFTVTPTGSSEVTGCIIYRGTTASFPKDSSTMIYNGTSFNPSIIAPDNQTYYYAAACYDDFGT